MISFDLRCAENHVFEGWFASGADYESQRERGLVSCPVCGDAEIAKAPMAPNVATRDRSAAEKPMSASEIMAMLRRLRREVERNADNVGDAFAEEARRIHYGEVDPRNIYGQTTPDEAEELRDEGIAFAAIPWVPVEDH
ncbi:MAG: DUF1178 family protein [Pseudomonadota bacterium]|nr:DUF1178 family protein [Pseudomonadota bacterium]